MAHKMIPCQCSLCQDSAFYGKKKCEHCGAHGEARHDTCQAPDCERVGSELARHAQERKIKPVMPPGVQANINKVRNW